MSEHDWLVERFEQHRTHLRAVAYRMLGSRNEADDAVQEAWLRVARADASDVENMAGWLTTIVARVCLNMLSARTSRREDPAGASPPEPAVRESAGGPEDQALLADSVGLALLVVLDTLAPAERLAFVLHDMFDVPFDEIAPIVERSPAAARQLASRARRRVRCADAPVTDPSRQREIITAFLAASRNGDFDALVSLLDPDVAVRADGRAVRMGAVAELHGAETVAEAFRGQAEAARPALVDGMPGAAWMGRRRPLVVFVFTIVGEAITGIELVAEPERHRDIDLVMLDG